MCVLWLVGRCALGDRCGYAHDRTYLPSHGWWSEPAQTTRIERGFQGGGAYRGEDPGAAKPAFLATMRALQNWREDEWVFGRYSELDDEAVRVPGLPQAIVAAVVRPAGARPAVSGTAGRRAHARAHAGGPQRLPAWEDAEFDEDEFGDLKWARELRERGQPDNWGFTNGEVHDLLSQGVKPWDDDAWVSPSVLRVSFCAEGERSIAA